MFPSVKLTDTVSSVNGADCSSRLPGSTGESHSATSCTPAATAVKIERVAVTSVAVAVSAVTAPLLSVGCPAQAYTCPSIRTRPTNPRVAPFQNCGVVSVSAVAGNQVER